MRHEALDSWSRSRYALRMGLHSTRRTGCIWPVLFLRLCGQNPVDLWIEAGGEPALRQRQFYRRQPDLSNRRGFSTAPRGVVVCAGAFPGALLPCSVCLAVASERVVSTNRILATAWECVKLRIIRCFRLWTSRSDTAPKLAAELWVHLDLRIPGYCRTGLDLFGPGDHLLKEIRCIDALA